MIEAWVIAGSVAEASEAFVSHQRVGNMFCLRPWPAETPAGAENLENHLGFVWSYPNSGERMIQGLRCHAYSGDWRKRRACFWSHLELWEGCLRSEAPRIILESDAVFTRRFDLSEIDARFGMVSLNDPRGATRKASAYHEALQAAKVPIVPVPWVDAEDVPQGLPGHSAYVLQPWFAAELLDKVTQVGAMPNDCLANKQWFPGKLGCLTRYATKVSGRPSTLA